jgi:hypothetical protein
MFFHFFMGMSSYGASAVTRTSDRGHVAEARNQGHRSGGVPIRVSKQTLHPQVARTRDLAKNLSSVFSLCEILGIFARLFLVYCNTKDNTLQTSGFPR